MGEAPAQLVDVDRARSTVGAAMARLEEDCSKSWPACPRRSILCDCRLRATHAINALQRNRLVA